MEAARTKVEISAFQGMVSNADPHDIQPGQAAVQVNLVADRPGQLAVRGGLYALTFDADDAS